MGKLNEYNKKLIAKNINIKRLIISIKLIFDELKKNKKTLT